MLLTKKIEIFLVTHVVIVVIVVLDLVITALVKKFKNLLFIGEYKNFLDFILNKGKFLVFIFG